MGFSVIDELIARYPMLDTCEGSIRQLCTVSSKCFEDGGRLFICGNGGSAADALHITGELMKSFALKRSVDDAFRQRIMEIYPSESRSLLSGLQGALPVYPLVENISLSTAYANDADAGFSFAQQVYGYARPGDMVWGISTSGNSMNVIRALMAAKGRGSAAFGLTGAGGGKMKDFCDVCVCVPETDTYKVQELHLPVYHAICLTLEEHFWGGSN